MIETQNVKYVPLISPAAILDNASATTAVVDTKGWDYADVIIQIGATDILMAALYLKESDDNSTNTNITGTIFGTSALITGATSALPTSTADDTIQLIQLDLRKRKRYIQVVATAGDGSAGTFLSGLVVLSRGKVAPDTAAEAGAAQILRV